MAVTPPAAHDPPPSWIRGAVRDVLEKAPGYHALHEDDRRSLAHAMVRVSSLAARLIEEEGDAHAATAPPRNAPLARAQSQPDFGASADRIAGTTQNVLNAVSFPRFVTDLINGVFRAMLDSNQTQMQQYVNLLNAVSASAEGFEGAQFGLMRVRQWLADHFPEAIEYEAPDVEPGEAPDPDEIANARLRLRSGASMPTPDIIRATLGMAPEDPLEASNPEQLVPIARRFLARQRQQMLATMVMMGMQRIVIDSGKINAAMRFHIDTRSAANQDQGSQTSIQNRIKGGGSFGFGPWGASAEVENTIGYVSTQRSQSTEEMNTDLDLNSSVELNFRSDYLPLNQMANQAQAERIRNSTINPAATVVEDPAAARATRQAAQRAAEEARRAATPIAMPTTPAAPSPSTSTPATTAPPSAPATGGATSTAPGATTTAPSTSGTTTSTPSTSGSGTTTTPSAPGTTPPRPPATSGTGGTTTTPSGSSTATAPAVAPGTAPPPTSTTAPSAPPSTTSVTAPAPAPTSGSAVGTQVGATVGGAAGTAAGGAVGGAIGAAAGGVGAVVGAPVGAAIGGAVGTAAGGLLGGAIGGAIESGLSGSSGTH
ncbi:hypothetical protein DWG18_07570 [Lysobacter sp. TY2-98]|uniref:hypothetical protein n=1 Tax=Lysobacter sp. TY2-98 TaxID=2290922 RepID=UPI000E1FF1C2|nr:hypothetical protein [Lysobacter sp. TY2-98]AXK72154.1 hypothetical protein DWG18_07570 [Lysobacter sp. TY2-98]